MDLDPYSRLVKKVHEIEKLLNYSFKDQKLLSLAFVHRSFVNEYKKIINENNERLEFLGDAVLGLVISEYLFLSNPDIEEGVLSFYRSLLVNATSCSEYLQALKVDSYLLLGKGEKSTGGEKKESILADVFEAIVGAIFLDGGVDKTKDFLLDHFKLLFDKKIKLPQLNYKAELQNFCQKTSKVPPTYEVIKEEGPSHAKTFYVVALLENQKIGFGEGGSKKEAESQAAKDALKNLGIIR